MYYPATSVALRRTPDPFVPLPQPARLELESTIVLLGLARAGRTDAVNALVDRCIPRLRHWAHGRLPASARGMADTEDLVQDTVINLLRHLDEFEIRHEGALQAYLRQAIRNRICDEARRVVRRPPGLELVDVHPDTAPSPLELAIGTEGIERYDAALSRLSDAHRQAVILRLELQYSYEEIAQALGRRNANAARSLVVRALYRLYEDLRNAG